MKITHPYGGVKNPAKSPRRIKSRVTSCVSIVKENTRSQSALQLPYVPSVPGKDTPRRLVEQPKFAKHVERNIPENVASRKNTTERLTNVQRHRLKHSVTLSRDDPLPRSYPLSSRRRIYLTPDQKLQLKEKKISSMDLMKLPLTSPPTPFLIRPRNCWRKNQI